MLRNSFLGVPPVFTKPSQKQKKFFFWWSWLSSRGFFFVLSEKLRQNWENFEKSKKCRAKKNIFCVEPVLLDVSLVHQSSCNTFFFEEVFFFWESGKKYILAPPDDPRSPPVICYSAKRFVYDGSDVHLS
jgi:hypothetical protein